MNFLIKPLAKLIAALNSNSKPQSVAAAVSFALLLAMMPAFNLTWLCLFIITMLFRINYGLEFAFLILFKLIIPLADPLIEPVGWKIMNIPAVSALIYDSLDIPVLILFDFNNSLLIGGFAAGLALWIPVFVIVLLLAKLFRAKIAPALAKSRLMILIRKAPFVNRFAGAVNQYGGMFQ